jgi:hypothetical protein
MRYANNALCHIQHVNPTFHTAIDLLNELRDSLVNLGGIKGY